MTITDKNNLKLSSRGATSYLNVAYSVKDVWAARSKGFENGYYIAVAALNDEEKKIAGKKTFMFHLGYFDDVRDAAYVAQTFDANREEYLPQLNNVTIGAWEHPHIPTWEYEAIDTEINVLQREVIKNRTARPEPKPVFSNSQLQNIFSEEVEIAKLYSEYSKIIAVPNRKDFKDDLADVVTGKCTIEQLINDYK